MCLGGGLAFSGKIENRFQNQPQNLVKGEGAIRFIPTIPANDGIATEIKPSLIVKLAGLLQVPHFFFEVNQRKPNRY
jgi:hypothetical protein